MYVELSNIISSYNKNIRVYINKYKHKLQLFEILIECRRIFNEVIDKRALINVFIFNI